MTNISLQQTDNSFQNQFQFLGVALPKSDQSGLINKFAHVDNFGIQTCVEMFRRQRKLVMQQ